MILSSTRSRQPPRLPWTLERLLRERATALEYALDRNTTLSYGSHLNSYIAFCDLHSFPLTPTPDTFSFYIVFMSHHIKPLSIRSYLSGIVHNLRPHFPDVTDVRRDPLVRQTLKGALRLYSTPVQRKEPLEIDQLELAFSRLSPSTEHDDSLFLALLLVGFHALLRLGDLVQPDRLDLRTFRKVSRRTSVSLHTDHARFVLQSHKADRLFEGADIVVKNTIGQGPDPFAAFAKYISSRDRLFPCHLELWLRRNGSIPTRNWFTRRLHKLIPGENISGHSMRAGGATALAVSGATSSNIQAIGRWSSDAWQAYVRKHPVLLHAILTADRVRATQQATHFP